MKQLKNLKTKISEGFIRRLRKAMIILFCFLSRDPEKQGMGRHLLRIRGLVMYPYPYAKKYDQNAVRVMRDEEGYPFVMHGGKRMYLQKGWSREKCQRYYNNLRIEQDKKCTHRYLTSPERFPGEEDVVADMGAAEGIFGLDVIERIKKIYLFEGDRDWSVPLRKTFMPWKDKVVIVEKYLSDRSREDHVSLDDFFPEEDVTYVKADIEGSEIKMLRGAERLLQQGIKKALLCVYHKTTDEADIRAIMEDHGFAVEVNPGYLVMTNPDKLFADQYLRHGVLFARKKTDEKV
ncbi:MAG: FkbM family methyltransferase [Lachnospiraceae bacterium]|nr:FkbM family methyltransferase [Lachnospiraceae bacterium]